MVKRSLVPILLLIAAVSAGVWVPWITPEPDADEIVRQSARLGWAAGAEGRDIALDVHERVNDERTARGLRPLAWHDGLATLAERWSEEMVATRFEHSPDGLLVHPSFVGLGENIAMGQIDSGELHVEWMRSDGHRENILGRDFTAMGVGVVCRHDGRMWATQLFGVTPQTIVAPQNPPTTVEPLVREDPGIACPPTGEPSP